MKQIRQYIKSIVAKTGFKLVRYRPDDSFETVKLALAFFATSSESRKVIQVGACDGKSKDPVFNFLKNGAFHGILIEPIPSNFALLKENYRGAENVTLVNAAISDSEGSRSIFSVKPEGKWKSNDWVKQFASFDRKHLIKMGIKPDEIAEQSVPTRTLSSICSEHSVHRIDALVVDTEGHDDVILTTCLPEIPPPKCIFFEFVHIPKNRLLKLCSELKARGYVWSFGTGNAICVHSDLVKEWLA